jgi:hypothetical protein
MNIPTSSDPTATPVEAAANRPARRSVRRRLMSLAGGALLALSLVGAQTGLASAASLGAGMASFVQCNYRYHTLTLIPGATSAPGFNAQTVWYRYYIKDVGTGNYVAGYNPTGWGSINTWRTQTVNGINYVNNAFVLGPGSTYNLVAGHRYTVVTEYSWLISGTYWSAFAGTSSYELRGYAWDAGNGRLVSGSCVV